MPYQLSDPTTCHPALVARPATVPASPVTPELLNTSTTTFERSIAGLAGLVWRGLGGWYVEWWALGLRCALGSTSCSVGAE